MSPARRSTKRKKRPAAPPSKTEPVYVLSGERSQRLGSKHLCFACGVKFYDLNRPEPICPKCQTNQLHKPKEKAVAPPPPVPAPRKPGADMAPLLEEEEDAEEGAFPEEDVGLELGDLETDETLFDEDEEVREEDD